MYLFQPCHEKYDGLQSAVYFDGGGFELQDSGVYNAKG
jgi:hypothetical protein